MEIKMAANAFRRGKLPGWPYSAFGKASAIGLLANGAAGLLEAGCRRRVDRRDPARVPRHEGIAVRFKRVGVRGGRHAGQREGVEESLRVGRVLVDALAADQQLI